MSAHAVPRIALTPSLTPLTDEDGAKEEEHRSARHPRSEERLRPLLCSQVQRIHRHAAAGCPADRYNSCSIYVSGQGSGPAAVEHSFWIECDTGDPDRIRTPIGWTPSPVPGEAGPGLPGS